MFRSVSIAAAVLALVSGVNVRADSEAKTPQSQQSAAETARMVRKAIRKARAESVANAPNAAKGALGNSGAKTRKLGGWSSGGGDMDALEFTSIGVKLGILLNRRPELFPEIGAGAFPMLAKEKLVVAVPHLCVKADAVVTQRRCAADEDEFGAYTDAARKKIFLNSSRWENPSEGAAKKISLVFHEYLRVLGIAADDKYALSARLLSFLQENPDEYNQIFIQDENPFEGPGPGKDEGFRWSIEWGACMNPGNQRGLNPGFVGECGDLRKADLKHVRMTAHRGFKDIARNLKGADLSGEDLSLSALDNVVFEDADLSEANLGAASLMRADLLGANLSGARLSGAYLTHAHVEMADFSRADLRGADLTETLLDQAKSLKGARFDSGTRLPYLWTVKVARDHGMIYVGTQVAQIEVWDSKAGKAGVFTKDSGEIGEYLPSDLKSDRVCFRGEVYTVAQGIVPFIFDRKGDESCGWRVVSEREIRLTECDDGDSGAEFEIPIPLCE